VKTSRQNRRKTVLFASALVLAAAGAVALVVQDQGAMIDPAGLSTRVRQAANKAVPGIRITKARRDGVLNGLGQSVGGFNAEGRKVQVFFNVIGQVETVRATYRPEDAPEGIRKVMGSNLGRPGSVTRLLKFTRADGTNASWQVIGLDPSRPGRAGTAERPLYAIAFAKR
jgi:hypothetical protein